MSDTKRKIIYYRESWWQSWLSDIGSVIFICGGFYINYRFIGNSHVVDVILLILILLMFIGKAGSKGQVYTDKAKLIQDLQKDTDNE